MYLLVQFSMLSPGLHPAFNLTEIAELADISGAILRKWRVEKEFQKRSRKGRQRLEGAIRESLTLENEGEEFLTSRKERLQIMDNGVEQSANQWISIFPFLHSDVQKGIYNFLKRKVEAGKTMYAGVFASLEYERTGNKRLYRKLRRKWARNSEWLSAYKKMLSIEIHFLANPQVHETLSAERIQELAQGFKKLVFALVDELAA